MGTILFDLPPLENSSYLQYQHIDDSYGFERLDLPYWKELIYRQRPLAFYAAAIYLFTIFGLEKFMKNRPAFNLRRPLILWNAALGVFSIVGFVRTAPILLKELVEQDGFNKSICIRENPNASMVFWSVAFGISKFIELGDTLFIVLRKRPLQVLQWYHHIMTLIVVWITLPYAEPVGRYYVTINYGVHAAMYPYFALKMAGIDVPKVIANSITTIQLAQMFAGFFLNGLTIAMLGLGYSCYRTPASIWAFVIVYGSFIVLFGKLFSKSVLKSNSRKHAKSL